MQIVILSGGTGKGLWPLSNEANSKQFLRFLDASNGDIESILQRTYRLIKEADIDAKVTITASIKHVDSIIEQLGHDIDLVIEPECRDTFPAIALASSYLEHQKMCNLDEIVVVIPSDTYTDISYIKALQGVVNMVQSGETNIALLGIKPQFASKRWGYIMANKEQKVTNFVEKPSIQMATELINMGALISAGVFAFRLGYMSNIIKEHGLSDSYDELYAQYTKLPKNSFDYEVLENERAIGVVPFNGVWDDLDTWKNFTQHITATAIGNVIGYSNNSHIINKLEIPILTLGVENLAIIASPDGILVSDKEHCEQLKVFADKITDRPMYENRRWGFYKVLNHEKYSDGYETLTKLLHLNEGCSISYQYHLKRDEIWTFVDGAGLLVIDDKQRVVSRGDVVHIRAGQKHAIKATTNLQIIEAQTGSALVEEDIFRTEWTWK